MGRPKTYDAEEIARKAMDLFWKKGYHATSTQDLVEHMDVNRFSLYAEFGSKQGLYEAALALYERDVVTSFFRALESPDAAIAEIDQQFAYVADRARRPGIKNGCLMCNSATERASDDLASRAVFADHFDRMSGAFTKALNNAKHRGEIRTDVRTTDEGRFLATTLLGFSVLMRSRVEPKVVVAAARAARRHLKGLMGDSS